MSVQTTGSTPDTEQHGVLYRFGLFLARHARAVCILGLLFLLGAAALGTTAFGKLQSGGFEDPAADSSLAAGIDNAHFPPEANLVVMVHADQGTVDDAAVRQVGQELTAELKGAQGLSVAASWFDTPAPGLVAQDNSSALILLVIDGDQGTAVERGGELATEISGPRGPATVQVGGEIGVFGDINNQVSSSLALAEAIAVPVTLILLILVFGSLVAALLPLLIGIFAIIGTFAELAILGSITDVSIFSINLTTALGLGLGIDYGLLLVARFREELAGGREVPEAVAHTVATAGRTIAFSAAAVIAALATLLVFPLYFLSSFGYAGIGVVLIAALGALVITPACLALLGLRVEKGKLPFPGFARGTPSPFWKKVAGAVFRRPILAAAPVLGALVVASIPLFGTGFALPDDTVLPPDAESRQVSVALDEQYPSRSDATFTVVSADPVDDSSVAAAATAVAAVPGVVSVDTAAGPVTATGTGAVDPAAGVLGADGYQRMLVHTSAPGGSDAASDLVADVRAALPGGFLVGGTDASLADTLAGIARPLPIALAIIVITTFVLLFLFTGSVLQPLRALVVNSLSLCASLGIVTWVFADGHLIELFGATARPMDASMTVLLFCIAFGLSMDYEVFLISRITELHDHGADLRTAVTEGLARTGRLVTSAALLLAVSFFAFTSSSVSMLQLFGLGAGLAVIIDATLIRGVLVPAAMRLLGPANFWAPAPLRRLHGRFALRD
ncbi:MMPL family transporter [Nakamurella sp. YIM 132087]|uniref:MMPL family transporter n=1 Tax=Nakamurella alba TaxID=2665158 RepID=A0A7K1FNY1_9ACTN|nr:MMPL family transporter [Nakamurella alba]MTD15856.1 MMPL family transporter [Nakamurella alba]